MQSKPMLLAIVLSAILAFAVMGHTTLAKESECKVDKDKNTCIITAKRGDVEIDKLVIVTNVDGGNNVNITGLEDQINDLKSEVSNQANQISSLQSQVSNFNDTGITSIEVTEGQAVPPIDNNTTIPGPVDNGTDQNNGTDNNGTQ
jgi:peptidoglycan hydrolase CwlO-like protein